MASHSARGLRCPVFHVTGRTASTGFTVLTLRKGIVGKAVQYDVGHPASYKFRSPEFWTLREALLCYTDRVHWIESNRNIWPWVLVSTRN
jgi:hypothetical protein